MAVTVILTDEVIGAISSTIGRHRPETGGALLGASTSDLVNRFIFDDEAATTSASYIPSDRLQALVQSAEVESGRAIELKGIIHSHPAGMNRPSSTDLQSFQDYLEANPHLNVLIVAICTFLTGSRTHLLENEVAAGDLRISWFVARRGRTPNAIPATPRVLPVGALKQAIEERTEFLCGAAVPSWVDGQSVESFEVADADARTRAIISVTSAFPTAAPSVFVAGDEGYRLQEVAWDFNSPLGDRFAELAGRLSPDHVASHPSSANGEPSTPAYGEPRAVPEDGQQRRPDRRQSASRLGSAIELMGRLLPGRPRTQPDLTARSQGILSASIAAESVLILGCGSVGSSMATLVARSGVQDFTLIDPDKVETHNIGRSEYRSGDIGRPKVEALASILRSISPMARVKCVQADINEVSGDVLRDLVEGSTLVVGACDSPKGQGSLAHFAYRLKRPGVFVGVYAKAAGGEIIASVPGGACFNCAVRGRDEISDPGADRQVDYDTGRLVAEPGLYADIRTMSSAATKVVLSLSNSLPKKSPLVEDFRKPIHGGRSWIAFGTTPDFWFFPQIIDGQGQHAFQTVWMSVERGSTCTTCGDDPAPLYSGRQLDAGALRGRLGAPKSDS